MVNSRLRLRVTNNTHDEGTKSVRKLRFLPSCLCAFVVAMDILKVRSRLAAVILPV
jgi:hypothetical protein